MHPIFPAVCLFVVTLSLLGAQKLDKRPLYPDGLTAATDLGPVLPKQPFKLSDGGQANDCTTQECAKIEKTFKIQTVIYNDNPSPITVCICDGSPYTTQSLADGFSQASLTDYII
jgi:hypothetical protein